MSIEKLQNLYCVECECPIRKVVYYESTEAKDIEEAKNIIQSQFPTMRIRSVSLITNKDNVDQNIADQNIVDQNTADQNTADQNTTDQNTTDQNTTDQNTTDQNTTDQNTTDQNNPEHENV